MDAKNVKENRVKDSCFKALMLMSTFICYFILTIPLMQFSIIFRDLATNAPTVITSWIFNLYNFTYQVATIIAGPLAARLSNRAVGVISGGLISFSFFCCTFVNKIEYLFLLYSIIAGVGSGLLLAVIQFVLGGHFTKRLGFAVAVATAGMSASQFAGPVLINYLIDNYGKYSFLLIGAITLNVCSFSLSFTKSESEKIAAKNAKLDAEENEDKSKTCCLSFLFPLKKESKKIFKNIINNLKLLRYDKAKIVTFSSPLIWAAQFNFMMLFPLSLRLNGISEDIIAYCFSIFSLADFVSKLILNNLTDMLSLHKRWYPIFGSTLMGVSIIAFTFVETPIYIFVCMATMGISMGATYGVYTVLIVDSMGKENLPQMIGNMGVVLAIGFILFGPLLGWIRDFLQSYSIALQSMSILCFLSTFLWALMPLAEKRDIKKLASENNI